MNPAIVVADGSKLQNSGGNDPTLALLVPERHTSTVDSWKLQDRQYPLENKFSKDASCQHVRTVKKCIQYGEMTLESCHSLSSSEMHCVFTSETPPQLGNAEQPEVQQPKSPPIQRQP
jgi:hypothetical protein